MRHLATALVAAAAISVLASNSFAQSGRALVGCWKSKGFGPSRQAPDHGDFGNIFCFAENSGVKVTGFMGHFVTSKYGTYSSSGTHVEFAFELDPTGITRIVWPAFAYAASCRYDRNRVRELVLTECEVPQGSSINGNVELLKMADKDIHSSLRPPDR